MIGRPVVAALVLALWARAQDTTPGGTTAQGASGAGAAGGYAFAYAPSGATVPIWSDIGRALILLFAGAPTKADEFGKDVLASPGTGGIRSALASHQGLVGIVTLLNYVLMAVVVLGGLGIVGARFAKKCGGQRMQVITPEYDDYYQYYLIAVGLTGGALMVTAVCLLLNKLDLGSAISDAYTHYDAGVTDVKTFISSGAADVPKPTEDGKTNGETTPGSSRRLRRLADTLNARFRNQFLEFLKRRSAMDAGMPSRDVLAECGRDAHSVSRALSAQGLPGEAALLAGVGRRCARLGRSREAGYRRLARAVEDATVVGRKQLLRHVLWVLRRAEDERADVGAMMSQTMGGFDNVLQRLSKYEADGGTVSWLSLVSGLPMLLMVLITLVAPVVAMVGMGIASRDHDLRPTVRSPQSNAGGLMLVYSAAAGLVCAMLSVYIYGLMYTVSAAGEIYVCEPFRSRSFKPLDELAYMLWPLSERGKAFAALAPSEVLTKCQSGAALSDLVVPAGFSSGGDADKAAANETKEPSPPPPSLQLRDALLDNATAPRDARRALRALVDALGALGPRSPSLRASVAQLTRKWTPLARPDAGNASAPDDGSLLERYYLEYMGDVESQLRWASAEVSRQGDGGGGGCQPVFKVLQAGLELLCDTFLSGCEGFWLAQLLLFVLLAVFAPLCLGLANHFLVMENYVYHGFDDKKVKRREERERLGLVKKKKKKKKKKEEDESEMDSSEGDDSTASDTSE